MKKLTILLSYLITILFISCEGSDTYRGSWNAMDADGMKFKIVFNTKSFSIKDSVGRIKNHEYSQNSVEIKNSIKTYGIQLSDGRQYRIHFPSATNDSTALIKDDNGHLLYTISRKNFIPYNDIYQLE